MVFGRYSSTQRLTRQLCTVIVKPKKKDRLGIAVFSTICIGTFGLGAWQMHRYYDKIEQQKSSRIIEKADSVCLSVEEVRTSFPQNTEDVLHGKTIQIKGRFLHEREVLVGLRSAPVSLTGEAAQGMALNPQGFYLVTPFVLEDEKSADDTAVAVIFVNRGWVPKDMKKEYWTRPEGNITLSCVLSKEEKQNTFSPLNDPNSKRLLWLEPKALLKATQLTDISHATYILEEFNDNEAAIEEERKTFPYKKSLSDLEEQYLTPEMHLSYAFTWFALSLAGFGMTFSKFRGRGRSKMRASKGRS